MKISLRNLKIIHKIIVNDINKIIDLYIINASEYLNRIRLIFHMYIHPAKFCANKAVISIYYKDSALNYENIFSILKKEGFILSNVK